MLAKVGDGSEKFINQCIAFRLTCETCGERFEEEAKVCKCGAVRNRCKNKAMANEQFCRTHAPSRYESVYNIVASKVADTTLTSIIESGKLRDLTAEFAMAKLAILELHANNAHAQDRLEALASFFNIAEKLQRLESGGLLNNAWNDPLIVATRNKFRQLIGVMVDIIVKYIPEETLRKTMLEELKERKSNR